MISLTTLGDFQLHIDGQAVDFGKRTSNALKLFLLLMDRQHEELTKADLIDQLFYSQDEDSNAEGNLRVTMFRLRKLLHGLGVPCPEGSDYILIRQGICHWNPQIPVDTDFERFERAAAKVLSEKTPSISAGLRALDLYTGEYLPFLNTEEWVITRQFRLTRTYSDLFRRVFTQLTEQKSYEKAYGIAARAAALYPFDDYQADMIECLIAMDAYDRASQVYTATAELYFRELGLEPSEHMQRLLARIRQSLQTSAVSAEALSRMLRDDSEDTGSFCCSLPSFIDNYRFVSRFIGRTGQSACLLTLTLTDPSQVPLSMDDARAQAAAETMKITLQQCLRKGDVFAFCGGVSFLILLMCANDWGCEIVKIRIQEKFRSLSTQKKVRLAFRDFPVAAPVPDCSRPAVLYGNQEVCVCIDHYSHSEIHGNAYHRFSSKPIPFDSMSSFFLRLNNFFDQVGFPQADRQLRPFPEHGEIPSIHSLPKEPLYTVADLMKHRGRLATFCLRVSHRRNLSFQGSVEVTETGKVFPFQSELQLIDIIALLMQPS